MYDLRLYSEMEGLNKGWSVCHLHRKSTLFRDLRFQKLSQICQSLYSYARQDFYLGEPAVHGHFLKSLLDNAGHRSEKNVSSLDNAIAGFGKSWLYYKRTL